MPFGPSLAPHIFIKITKVLASHLTSMGISILMYLDDWLVSAQSKAEAIQALILVLRESARIGFLVNVKKSVLWPT